jgi:ACS family hexuronate transporter-like MFS transporter
MERLSFESTEGRSASWKWMICGLLFLATMLMYMDRQTLSQMSKRVKNEFGLTNEQYGNLEWGFGLAFATGALVNGLLADRVSVRWLYPIMLIGWSLAGVATAWSKELGNVLIPIVGKGHALLGMTGGDSDAGYLGLFVCRVALGYFEAGHWPCALITTQRLLRGGDRTLGNSVLQSGASIGSVFTPVAVMLLLTDDPGSWRRPFIIIGLGGISWVIPWLFMIRDADLKLPPEVKRDANSPPAPSLWSGLVLRRIVVLLSIVITINMTWQYLRAWMPLLLQEEHGYSERFVLWFMMAFWLVADIGCLASGAAVKGLTARGVPFTTSRIAVFALCTQASLLTAVAANLPAGWLLLVILLLVSAGGLGLFPIYYSLSQDLSTRRQGMVTGLFGATTWIISSTMQPLIGRSIDKTHSYAAGLFWMGMMPLIGCLVFAWLWPDEAESSSSLAPVLRGERQQKD